MLLVAQVGLGAATLLLLAFYHVAFLRAVGRLAGAGGARFAAAAFLFTLFLLLGQALGVVFHQSLMQGIGDCAIR